MRVAALSGNLATVLLCSNGAFAAESAPLHWVRDLDVAKKIAADEHKDLLVVFTGLEWCGACIQLDREVLSRPPFATAEQSFVLVDLDFPGDRAELGELQERYNAWLKQYFVHGLPTVMLADAAGRPYAYFTGFEEGWNTSEYLQRFEKAQETRQVRDRELAAAQQANGAERAKRLHAALAAIAGNLETLEEREDDDALLVFYKPEVDEIRAADTDGKLKLREVYDGRAAARDAFRQRRAALAPLDQFKTKEDCPAAIAYIEKALQQTTDGAMRFELEDRRHGFLDWNEQYAEEIESLHRLQQDPNCPADERKRLIRNEAIALSHAERLDEAIGVYDRAIEAATEPGDREYLLSWKASMMLGRGRHEETIAAARAYLAATKPGSYKAADAASYLAWDLKDAGQYAEAITAYEQADEYFRVRDETWCRI
ncbi:MAG: thioredoxin family protein, partial [Singulisphaera sp.]